MSHLGVLQRCAGNRAVQRLIERSIQRQPSGDPKDQFRIEGGQYSAAEKKRAAEHPAGLILTTSVIGRLERSLGGKAPAPISVGKEWIRFEGGKLGNFVSDYNNFTGLSGEVLTGIGRLRDLLSAGAPEAPTDMTTAQKRALRPTDNSPATGGKKSAYRAWRSEQARYATDEGGPPGGLVFEVGRTQRAFDLSRQRFWQAQGRLERRIEEAKQLDKPKYEALDLGLKDALDIALAIGEDTVTAGVGIIATGADMVTDAMKKRAEFDEKMAKFEKAIESEKKGFKDDFEALQGATKEYWEDLIRHKQAVRDRDKARSESRQLAGLFGQSIGTQGMGDPQLAEVRMPALVADAWHGLAVIGQPARDSLKKVLAGRGVVERASNKDLKWRGHDPGRFSDISQVRDAWKRALSWEPVLAADDVEEWRAISRLWEEALNKFNV